MNRRIISDRDMALYLYRSRNAQINLINNMIEQDRIFFDLYNRYNNNNNNSYYSTFLTNLNQNHGYNSLWNNQTNQTNTNNNLFTYDIENLENRMFYNIPNYTPNYTPNNNNNPNNNDISNNNINSIFDNIDNFFRNLGFTRINDNHAATEQQINNAVWFGLYSNIINPINTQCTITQNNFTDNTRVAMIKQCKHIFEENALKSWFNYRSTCPVCRYDIQNYVVNNNTNTSTTTTTTDNTNNVTNTTNLTNLTNNNTTNTTNPNVYVQWSIEPLLNNTNTNTNLTNLNLLNNVLESFVNNDLHRSDSSLSNASTNIIDFSNNNDFNNDEDDRLIDEFYDMSNNIM